MRGWSGILLNLYPKRYNPPGPDLRSFFFLGAISNLPNSPGKGPSSAVENRKRFSTAEGEKKNLGFVFAPSGH